jgi:hypothetical protein
MPSKLISLEELVDADRLASYASRVSAESRRLARSAEQSLAFKRRSDSWRTATGRLRKRFRSPSRVAEDRARVRVPTIYVPGTRVLLLSRPSKMPGPSWSLPAGPACPFAVYGEDSICGSCYASVDHAGSSRYGNAVVQHAQAARFDWAKQCMRSNDGYREFVSLLTEAIEIATRKQPYMRVHDSGDLFSARYTMAWAEICAALPNVHFWFPTRSWRAPWLATIQELAALPNVAVRPSALHFDAPAPQIAGLAAGTTAAEVGFTCPAPFQGNACGSCRTCWDRRDKPVSYHAH